MSAVHSRAAVSVQRADPAVARVARAFGWALAAVAMVALAYELFSFVETGIYRPVPAGELWFDTNVSSLNLMQAVVQRYLHPFLWDPIIAGVLQWPAWSLLGAPAAVLVSIAFGRRQ